MDCGLRPCPAQITQIVECFQLEGTHEDHQVQLPSDEAVSWSREYVRPPQFTSCAHNDPAPDRDFLPHRKPVRKAAFLKTGSTVH
ncbi:hypothetical protein GRJ2_002118500 [Grus japonensis]|uniref:Uncharacterized protein n=1 Tax=Grus japonensis TaxID=30415 RepID=A0ABC9XGP5_GRUJA